MAHLKHLILIAALVCFVNLCYGGPRCALTFNDCGSKAGSLSSVVINGTCSSGKAVLQHGTFVSVTFDFTTKSSEAVLKSKVQGKVGVLPFIDFHLDNPDACVGSGLTCPVPANTPVSYQVVFHILRHYPVVNVIVQWELQNQGGLNVFCSRMAAVITA